MLSKYATENRKSRKTMQCTCLSLHNEFAVLSTTAKFLLIKKNNVNLQPVKIIIYWLLHWQFLSCNGKCPAKRQTIKSQSWSLTRANVCNNTRAYISLQWNQLAKSICINSFKEVMCSSFKFWWYIIKKHSNQNQKVIFAKLM